MEWITCVAALFHAFPILVQSASAPTSLDAHGLTILVLGQPWMEGNEVLNKCSDADWKEYVGAMGKFSSLVTEAVHSLEMGIELKMPDDKYKEILRGACDARLEASFNASTDQTHASHNADSHNAQQKLQNICNFLTASDWEALRNPTANPQMLMNVDSARHR